MNQDWNEAMYTGHANDLHAGLLRQPYYDNQGPYGEERFIGPFIVPFVGALAGGLLAGTVFRPNYNYYPPYPVYGPYSPYQQYPQYPYYPPY